MNAPMGGVAGGRLAAAVSAAGGLGMIGVGSVETVQTIEKEIRYFVAIGLRYRIGLIDWTVRSDPALLDAAITAKPAMLALNVGDDMDVGFTREG